MHPSFPRQDPKRARSEQALRTSIRWLVASVSFSLVAVLFLTMDFGDRGYHFEPDRRLASNVVPDDGDEYDLSRLRVLTRCVGYIRANYVDPSRAHARDMILAALDEVEQRVPEVMADAVRSGTTLTGVRVQVADAERTFDLSRVDDLYTMSWKMLDIFEFVTPHLNGVVDPKEVEYSAVNGMLRTLDPHSVLLTPGIYREMKLGTTGKFGGLGIVIGTQEGRLVVQSVMDGTPARRAGLKSGDRIVQIEAESTVNMTLSEAVERLRGAAGTAVTIWVERKSLPEPKKFRIVRSNITLASVSSRLLGGGVGYAHIKSFQQSTGDDLRSALERLAEESRQEGSGDLAGLVLDLRDNPGGLLDQAIEVSNLFLSDGVIVTTVGTGSKVREEKVATAAGTFSDLPLIVLLNEGSASASEIVAGALRNHDRALLMGQRTFGKGSVQVIYDIDDAALKLTIAQYLTPGDESIQSVGITPHVELVPVVVTEQRVDLDTATDSGEATLENHLLNGEKVRPHEPDVRLSHLEEDASDGQDDFSIVLARRMLGEAGRSRGRDMLTRARPILSLAQSEQTRRVVGALGKLDIDWNSGPAPARAELLATLEVDSDGGRAKAGEKAVLHLTVENRGSQTVHQVRARTRAPVDAFDGLDFVLGRIPAGQRRTWKVTVDVPRSFESQLVPVTATLFSGAGHEPLRGVREAQALVAVLGLARPHFGYTLQVVDTRGNGDGRISPGEAVELRVRVHNVGTGAAEKVLAVLKNRGGEEVFITEGRAWLEDLKAGESRDVTFSLDVRDSVPETGIQLELGVADAILGQRMDHRLDLPLLRGDVPTVVTEPARLRIGPVPTPIYGGAAEATGVLGVLAPGTELATDERIGEYRRLRLAGGGFGWIRAADLTAAADAAVIPQETAFEPRVQVSQPTVDVADQAVETDADAFDVRGAATFPWIEGQQLPDVYVFRGHDKVFFGRAASVAPNRLEFDARVPLEPGLNAVSIVARAGRELSYRKKLWIYRR